MSDIYIDLHIILTQYKAYSFYIQSMKPFLSTQQSSLSSKSQNANHNYDLLQSNSKTYKKNKNYNSKHKTKCRKMQKLLQSSFNLSSATLSSVDDMSHDYNKKIGKLAITNTVKEQYQVSEIIMNLCKIQPKSLGEEQKYIQRQVQTINRSCRKIFKVIDFCYEPPQQIKPPCNTGLIKSQHELKKQRAQNSLFEQRTKSTSQDIDQSEKLSDQRIKSPIPATSKKSQKKKMSKSFKKGKKNDYRSSRTRSNQKGLKKEEQNNEFKEELGFNLEQMRNCKCCGKLVTKLCFRCPHIYCNADNCSRKKKQLLNQRMLQKMKQDKIQQHYRQREVFQQKFRLSGSSKARQQLKFQNHESSEQEDQQSNQDSNVTNQICQQSSQDESSEKTLMFLKKNQKRNKQKSKRSKRQFDKKQTKKMYLGGIIRRKKMQDDQEKQEKSQNKRNLRVKKNAQIFQDSNE